MTAIAKGGGIGKSRLPIKASTVVFSIPLGLGPAWFIQRPRMSVRKGSTIAYRLPPAPISIKNLVHRHPMLV
ncbi:hypothetical protein CEXT_497711 [Caerostris extrusa]|uniref:Uncharacterized protein n=1 Tax=Caerostris extrusa TaxID=172846 RepID=A0AAV4XR10_CAEEX|nr:hypothetical protein CEXT_497711 [Caerostris extrusa]